MSWVYRGSRLFAPYVFSVYSVWFETHSTEILPTRITAYWPFTKKKKLFFLKLHNTKLSKTQHWQGLPKLQFNKLLNDVPPKGGGTSFNPYMLFVVIIFII